LEDRDTDHLFSRMESVVRASVLGVLAIATVQGLLGGLAFAVLGLPSPLLWGTIMTILAILPLVGTGLVWGPAALLLAFEGRYLAAAALALFGLLVIGSVDNFLRPRLVGQRTQMHELVIFFSVLGGLRVFGMLGIVLGPVVVAGTLVLFEAFRSSSLWSSERRSV
jgi:predicted PurR-regulated permease PerM